MIDRCGRDCPMGSRTANSPVKKCSAAGTVRDSLVDVNEMAKTKSFQQIEEHQDRPR